jgi:hypothetical protein
MPVKREVLLDEMLTGIYEEGYLVDKDEMMSLKALGTVRTRTICS